jgi:ribosomal protein S18 acetylase RimI-like enzyme
MEFLRANELSFDPRPQMGRIFVEGFYQWLKYFSKDKEKLSRAMTHIFNLDCFYLAAEGNNIAVITACTNGKSPPIELDKKTLCQTLGFIAGRIAYMMLSKHLVNHPYPFEVMSQTGSIEFVATSPEFRGRGVAHGLIEHIINTESYSEYVLEVASNNASAIRLYEKLGFVEFKRTPAPKQGGFEYLLYMRKAK